MSTGMRSQYSMRRSKRCCRRQGICELEPQVFVERFTSISFELICRFIPTGDRSLCSICHFKHTPAVAEDVLGEGDGGKDWER